MWHVIKSLIRFLYKYINKSNYYWWLLKESTLFWKSVVSYDLKVLLYLIPIRILKILVVKAFVWLTRKKSSFLRYKKIESLIRFLLWHRNSNTIHLFLSMLFLINLNNKIFSFFFSLLNFFMMNFSFLLFF